MEDKKVANNEEGEEVDVKKEEVFEVGKTSWFYSRAPGH